MSGVGKNISPAVMNYYSIWYFRAHIYSSYFWIFVLFIESLWNSLLWHNLYQLCIWTTDCIDSDNDGDCGGGGGGDNVDNGHDDDDDDDDDSDNDEVHSSAAVGYYLYF